MGFLFLGIVLLALKMAAFGPVAAWDWWLVLAPFVCAVLWWAFSDSIGLTRRRAMEKMEATKAERRARNLEALGLGPRRERKARHAKHDFPTPDAGRRNAVDPTTADPTQR